MEGDSFTLHTDLKIKQQDKIIWEFQYSQIGVITGYLSYICTDDKCKKIFRDRIKLDNQTGSLTITNTRTTDSGLYYLEMFNGSIRSEIIFSVTVNGESLYMKPSLVHLNHIINVFSGHFVTFKRFFLFAVGLFQMNEMK